MALLEVQALHTYYGHVHALKGIDLKVNEGEIVCLIGANGAGKSTTFKMMCGLLKPTAGESFVAGLHLARSAAQARARLGYMAQKFSLYGDLTVRQNLFFFSGAYGLRGKVQEKAVAAMVDVFDLEPFLAVSAAGLPLGFKQRLALACAVVHQPDVLFLDEPTSGVDPITRREFWNHINGLVGKGVTVLVTTHFMDEAEELCDRIAIIDHGRIVERARMSELLRRLRAAHQGIELPSQARKAPLVSGPCRCSTVSSCCAASPGSRSRTRRSGRSPSSWPTPCS